jgi:dihydrofolate reductase
MRKLIYSIAVSLDGYINDANGSLDWVPVDEEYHRFANAQQAETGLSIYGTNMWRTMVYWNTADQEPNHPDYMYDFARLWKPSQKLVVSHSLNETDLAAGARLMRDGLIDEVRRLKAEPGNVITVSGATIASTLIDAGLVDEVQPLVVPAILGGGTRFLQTRTQSRYDLAETRRFKNGMTLLRCVKRQ